MLTVIQTALGFLTAGLISYEVAIGMMSTDENDVQAPSPERLP